MSPSKNSPLYNAMIQLAAVVAGSVGYIEEQIIQITEGIFEQNAPKIEQAGKYTKDVRKLTTQTVQKTIETFVIHKPQGSDAKLILISWRIATALERISMLLYDIANQGTLFSIYKVPQAKTALMNMRDSLMSQTYNMVLAYTGNQPNLIQEIIQKETHIRQIYQSLFEEMIYQLGQDTTKMTEIKQCLDIAKIFEQIAYYMHEIALHLSYKYKLDQS